MIRRHRRALVALAGFLLAWGAMGPGCGKPAPRTPQTAFHMACARCHGESGEGGGPALPPGVKPPDFRDPAWQRTRTDMQLRGVIAAGRGAMPAFAGVIADSDIELCIRYLRSLAPPPPPDTPAASGKVSQPANAQGL